MKKLFFIAFLLLALSATSYAGFKNGYTVESIISRDDIDGELISPQGMFFDNKMQELYVVDSANNRIQIYSRDGSLIFQFGDGLLSSPLDVAVDGEGKIFTVESGKNEIKVFNYNGEFLSSFAVTGTPSRICIYKENLYLLDNSGQEVLVYDKYGNFISKFIKASSVDLIMRMTDISIDNKGNLYISDMQAHRISCFDKNGELILSFGSSGSGKGRFSFLNSVFVDNTGKIWTVDANKGEVQVFSEKGEYMFSLGRDVGLYFPNSVEVDNEGRCFISDTKNKRVVVYITSKIYEAKISKKGGEKK